MRDFQLPGRSTVHGQNGAAATSHPLATLTAIEILKAGGNAVDASVAACAVLCVVEPMSTGVGGDCFALYAPGGGPNVIGLNGSGRSPSELSLTDFEDEGLDHIPVDSPHAVTIPGAIDAWCRIIADHGKMEMAQVLAPAIGFAEDGFVVSPMVSLAWRFQERRLSADAGARAHYLIDGAAPKLGSVFHSPALGGTLRAIAERGRAGFYEGDVAADIVECLRKLGGKHATDDFFATCSNYVTPIRSEFNGIDVCEIPPNGQGITALIMLNILKRLPMREADAVSADRYHYQLEAQRLAFEARDKFVADPEFAEAPVEYLLSDVFADEMAARISPRRAIESVDRRKGPEYRDTIYLTVVDRDRNACSFINSLYFPFGSAITSPKSGVVLQNRGAGFSLDAKHPNRLEPRKRPLHTIIPGMAMDRGRAAFSFGVMGGDFQPMGHAQVVLNIVEYGMDPQEALDAPRMFAGLGSVAVERGVPAAIVSDLQERGHVIDIAAAPLGGGQIIQIDWVQGALIAGSESRKDGCAMAY